MLVSSDHRESVLDIPPGLSIMDIKLHWNKHIIVSCLAYLFPFRKEEGVR